jgi:hypothetical protein
MGVGGLVQKNVGEFMSEPLKDALAQLQREFPDESLTEVRLEFKKGERHDNMPSESWSETTWRVQAGNEHGYGDSLENALVELRKELGIKALVPDRAQRLAAILREIPERGFERHTALSAAQAILEEEARLARTK